MAFQKVLLIEDEPDAALMLGRLLQQVGYAKADIIVCRSLAEMAAVEKQEIELVITDLSLPDSSYTDTFPFVQEAFPHLPIIVLTGAADTEMAIMTMQQGAEDYLEKGTFSSEDLQRAIRFSRIRKKISSSYKRLFDESPAPMYIFDTATYQFLAVNGAALQQYGYTREEFLAMKAVDIRPEADVEDFKLRAQKFSAAYSDIGRVKHIRKNGDVFHVHVYAHSTEFNNRSAKSVLALNIDLEVKAEQEIIEKAQEIARQNERLKEVAWIQSHELRRPVANIMGLVKLFNKEEASDPNNKKLIEYITMAATELDDIVRKIINHIS